MICHFVPLLVNCTVVICRKVDLHKLVIPMGKLRILRYCNTINVRTCTVQFLFLLFSFGIPVCNARPIYKYIYNIYIYIYIYI